MQRYIFPLEFSWKQLEKRDGALLLGEPTWKNTLAYVQDKFSPSLLCCHCAHEKYERAMKEGDESNGSRKL